MNQTLTTPTSPSSASPNSASPHAASAHSAWAPSRGDHATPSAPPRIAIIGASWHGDIVGQGIESLRKELARGGVPAEHVQTFTVPGAFEIPLHAQRLALGGHFDAIVAVAFVVNGGIYRHEFVSAAVIDGLMRVQLDSDVPVFSAVLTPRDFHETEEHQQFFLAHFVKKGAEVANACLQTLRALASLPMH